MAKKKQKSSDRAAKKRTKKKVAKKGVAKSKKSPPKKAPRKARKKTPKRATKASSNGTGAKSVDGILKKYEKERSAQGSQLATLGKKIADLQAKTRVYQEQIAKLQGQEDALQVAIAKLDSHRDDEVGRLLAKLGVQLGDGASGSTSMRATADSDDQFEEDVDAADDDSGEVETATDKANDEDDLGEDDADNDKAEDA